MYYILDKVVRETAIGEELLDEHNEDYDARAVFEGLKDFHEQATVGEFVRNKLLDNLDLKITEWKSSHQYFFARWKRLWQQLVDLKETFKRATLKRMFLQKAIDTQEHYMNVTDTEQVTTYLHDSTGKKLLTFVQYW